LLHSDLPVLHLAPDGVRFFLAAGDIGFDAGGGKLGLECAANIVDQTSIARAQVI
jgi:hypothetical protein